MRFAAVGSIRMHGRMRFGQEPFTAFNVTAERPNKLRMELTVGPDHIVQAYDGTTGWQSVSGQHNQPPTPLAGDILAHLIDQAANVIGGPLLDLEKRGNKVEYAGREAVNGFDCFKLNVTFKTGNTRVLFIDSSSFREVQEEYPVRINGQPAIVQQTIGDYRQFGPIWLACLFVTRQKDAEDSQRMEIVSVEINPVIDESIFKLPASAPSAAAGSFDAQDVALACLKSCLSWKGGWKGGWNGGWNGAFAN